MSKPDNNDNYDSLLGQYLALCNKAIEQNRDRFPYSQIWHAAETAMGGKEVEFALVDDEPKARVSVCLKDAGINWHDAPGDGSVPIRRISADYIRSVLSDPEKVIANPSLLNWDWLIPPKAGK